MSGDTTHANNDYSPVTSSCTGYGENGPDVVYAFTPSADGSYTFTLTPESLAYDAAIYLLSSCPASGSSITSCVAGADRGTGGASETLSVQLTGGTTYLVIVDGYGGSGGPFTLSVAAGSTSGSTGTSGTTTGTTGTTGSSGSSGTSGTSGSTVIVTTLAGNGSFGFADGTGANAELDLPMNVALDTAGNVYVADSGNNRIRKVDPSGNVTTLAGNGTQGFADGSGGASGTAKLNLPMGVAVDAAGNVYVADSGNNRIRKVDPIGNVTTLAGNGAQGFADGTGGANGTAKLNFPIGVAVDATDNVYVADGYNHRIRKIDPSGNVTTLAGNGTASFADGTGGANGSAELDNPHGVAVDASGNVYVGDTGNHRIRKIDPSGNVTTLAGNGAQGFADGTGGASGTAEFYGPSGVAVDASGNVYVADSGNNRIRKVAPNGDVTTLAGNGTPSVVDGTGGANGTAEFYNPSGVTVEASGTVYVGDTVGNRIRRITP